MSAVEEGSVSFFDELTNIGVAEHKPAAEFVFMPVHFTADDTEQCLAINQDLHTILFNYLVELVWLLHVL